MRGRLHRPTVAALLLALVASVTFTTTAPAQTDDEASQIPDCDRTLTPFDDVPPGHWAAADVSCMYSLGVITGKTPTTFAPSDKTKRSHSAAMLARLWRAFGKDCPAFDGDAVFDDVPADHWAAADIYCMHSLGVIKGKTTTKFAPSAKALRSHTAVMMARLWRALGKDCPAYDGGPFTDVPTSHWASRDIVCMHDIGVVNGKTPTQFAPSDDTRRAHTAAMMSRLWRAYRGELPAAAGGGGGGAFGGFGGGGDPQAGNQQAGNQQTSGQQTRAITPPPQQIEGTPNAPGAPSLTVGNGSLGVSFSWPPHTGAAFSGFTVWYCTSGELDCTGAKTSYKATNSSNPSTTISNLTKGTKYYVRVRAHNLNGAGAWSNASSATPLDAPRAPTNLSAVGGKSGGTPVGSGKLDVSWTEPDQGNNMASNMASVTGYRLQHSTNGSTWTSVTLSGTGTSTTVTNLDNGTAYWVRVQANSSVGYGAWSSTVTAKPSTKPAAPATPTVSIASRDSLSVSWTAPANNGEAITDYDVQYKTSSASTWTDKSHTGTGRSTTITGLTNGTAYNVQVRATNSVGSSAWSSSGTATPAAVPAAPALTVSVGSGTSLSVSWTAPANNGEAITDYDVQYKKSSDSGWTDKSHTGTGTSTTITGLTQGTTYNVRVRATNSVGSSAWASSTGTPAKEPATPAAPTVNIASGTSLSVSWTAPANNGEAITDYDVQYKKSSDSGWTDKSHTGTGTSTTITGLTQGTTYNVRVRTTNSVGSSEWSSSGTATPATVPPAPTGVTVTSGTSVGSGKLKVSWTAPTNNGGAAITGYKIQWKSGTQEFSSSRQRTDTASPYTITGLTNGTAYTVQVLAVNSVGDSAASNTATGTPHYYPAAPGTPSVVGGKSGNTIVGSGKLNVSWNAPSDNGGSAITDYDLRYRFLGNGGIRGPWNSWNHSGTATTATITGLTNGTAYQVQVQATNSHGDSGWSDSGWSAPATKPSTPYYDATTGLDETVDGTSMKLTICTKGTSTTCVSDDHGATEVTYYYYWKQCADNDGANDCTTDWPTHANYSVSYQATPAKLTTSITSLTQGKKYAIRVRAKNSVGWSAYSATAMGTPHTVPGKPTINGNEINWVNNVLAVNWTSPTNTGGKSIDGWTVYYCSSIHSNCSSTNPLGTGGSIWTQMTGTGNPGSATILSTTEQSRQCKYWVYVSLKNAAGYGSLSDIVTTRSATPACTS